MLLNNNIFENIFYELLIINIFGIILTFFYKKISSIFKLYDYPNSERKIHKEPISLFIGLKILIILNLYFILDIFFLKLSYLKINLLFLILINIFYIIGYADDIKNLSPRFKSFLIFCSLLVLIPLDQTLIIKNLEFENLYPQKIELYQSSIFITIFFIYIFYNLLNFSDGLNGISITVSIFFILALIIEKKSITNVELILIIALILSLFLNLQNKSFTGNSGISVISIYLSINYIYQYNVTDLIFCDTIFIIFFIPGIDMTRLVFSRILEGNSISEGDLNHLHHLLMHVVKKEFVFIIYILITIFPYFLSKLMDNNLITIILSLTIYIFIVLILRQKRKKTYI